MRHVLKLVAMMVIVAGMAAPAAAIAGCWTSVGTDDSGMACPNECPMMGHESDASHESQTEAADGSCCQISSGQPTPPAVTQIAVSIPQLSVVATETPVVLPMAAPASHDEAAACRTCDASPQALLCTFLI